MQGIYVITNKINGYAYIGQSTDIDKRWYNHKSVYKNKSAHEYNYPLYKDMRKFGIDNFDIKIIEKVENKDLLLKKEHYWINLLKPKYNQTIGISYQCVEESLNLEQVREIQDLLMSDKNVSHVKLSKIYNVHKDTIRDINVGRTWHDDNLNYPLHKSKFYYGNEKNYCIDCGKEISYNSLRCSSCYFEYVGKKIPRISRDELKSLIRNNNFKQIGKLYGVSDNAVRKWCDKYNLPRRKVDIIKYSDEEWLSI